MAWLAMAGAAMAATTAGTVALAGPAGASPAPAARSGIERFQIINESFTSYVNPAIAYGVFTATGKDHSTANGNVDTFTFANGLYKVRSTAGKGPQSYNSKTCLLTLNQHGTFTLFGGTGAYKGITGHGSYTVTGLAVWPKKAGKCDQKLNPLGLQFIIKGSGPVKIP